MILRDFPQLHLPFPSLSPFLSLSLPFPFVLIDTESTSSSSEPSDKFDFINEATGVFVQDEEGCLELKAVKRHTQRGT